MPSRQINYSFTKRKHNKIELVARPEEAQVQQLIREKREEVDDEMEHKRRNMGTLKREESLAQKELARYAQQTQFFWELSVSQALGFRGAR